MPLYQTEDFEIRELEVNSSGMQGEFVASANLDQDTRSIFNDANPNSVRLSLRHGLALAGLDADIGFTEAEGKEVFISGSIRSQRVNEAWLPRMHELKPRLGNLLYSTNGNLSRAEVFQAIKDGQVKIDESYEVTDDGTILIQLSPVRFILSSYLFSLNSENIDRVLVNGRRGFDADLLAFNPMQRHPILQPNEHGVFGLKLSLLGHTAVIDEQQADGLRHFGSFHLDPIRSTGLHPDTSSLSYLQAQLVNEGSNDADLVNFKLRLKLYNPSEMTRRRIHPILQGLDKDDIHQNGITFADAVGLRDPDNIQTLLGSLSDTHYGLLVSPKGDALVPKDQYSQLQTGLTEHCIQALNTGTAPQLKDIKDRMTISRDQGILFVTNSPPDAESIVRLTKKGVRVFIFSDQNQCFTAEQHLAMQKVVTNYGVEIYCLIEGKLRILHKGLFADLDGRQRLDKVTFPIAMYGSIMGAIAQKSEEDLNRSMQILKSELGDEGAIMHANGTGTMHRVDQAARENGIINLGLGTDLALTPNFKPDGFIRFKSDHRIYRHTLLERFSASRVFGIGGTGTLEEIALAINNLRLGKAFPAPLNLVDPTFDQSFWDQLIAYIYKISTTNQITAADGTIVSLKDTLAPEHLQNYIKVVPSYEAAAYSIVDFVRNPQAFFDSVGLNQEALKAVLNAYSSQTPFKLASFLNT